MMPTSKKKKGSLLKFHLFGWKKLSIEEIYLLVLSWRILCNLCFVIKKKIGVMGNDFFKIRDVVFHNFFKKFFVSK